MRDIKTQGRVAFFSFSLLKKIGMIAVPSILQQSFVSVGNIFIQSLVNSYGSGVIAGYSAAIKLNTFIITGFTTLGNGVSGFTAQNRGAGKQERIRDGFMAGLKMAVCVAVPFFAAYFFFGRTMVLLFMEDTGSDALRTGIQFLKIVSPFYFVIAVKVVADGMLRGAERMKDFYGFDSAGNLSICIFRQDGGCGHLAFLAGGLGDCHSDVLAVLPAGAWQ